MGWVILAAFLAARLPCPNRGFSCEKLSVDTIKNRVAQLRWLADKIGKQNILPRGNAALSIARRVYVTNQGKALVVPTEVLAQAKSDFVRASLRLQAALGLRRAESIKIQPGWACPAAGAPTSRQCDPKQREQDQLARLNHHKKPRGGPEALANLQTDSNENRQQQRDH